MKNVSNYSLDVSVSYRDGLLHIWKNQKLHSVHMVWSYSVMKG